MFQIRIVAMLFALVLSLGLAAPVAAGPFEDGNAALNRGDFATALRLLRPLAEQGLAAAQSALGFMYVNGDGVQRDVPAAMTWWRKAADQGDVTAQMNIALMYIFGDQSVPQDYAEALKWWRKAANQGDVSAQLTLGDNYEQGVFVPQDYVQAHMWFNLAAAGASDAEDSARAVKNRNRVAEKMTLGQITEAQKLAREWKPKSNQ